MRLVLIGLFLFLLSACGSKYPNQLITGQTFPSVNGNNLEQKALKIPDAFDHQLTLLLVGYKQDSQFDIDRWLIGLDMTGTQIPVYELPTMQGLFPRMFSTMIDNGMRKGIPKPLWKGVITIYQDGDSIQAFTGNESPNNARVILLGEDNKIVYFYDDGFAVEALNQLRKVIEINR